MDGPHSVKVETATEEISNLKRGLGTIAWILASPDWSVGMLEDIAEIVTTLGFTCDQHDEYIHH